MKQEIKYIYSNEIKNSDYWVCPNCETENGNDSDICETCGYPKHTYASKKEYPVKTKRKGKNPKRKARSPVLAAIIFLIIVIILIAILIASNYIFEWYF